MCNTYCLCDLLNKLYLNKTELFFLFKIKEKIHWEKNAIESKAFLSKSMYIMDTNQYAIELVTYW